MKDLKQIIKENKLFFIAGPCVIESEKVLLKTAEYIKKISKQLGAAFYFKSSYKKANRSIYKSYRGPGLKKGLALLQKVKSRFSLPILTDVHEVSEVQAVAEVADIIQIPAFLCRQTALIEEAARTGKWVNIKKGQFMAPEDMKHAAEKVFRQKNKKVLITERGTTFGYHNLVVDFRSIPIIKDLRLPVIFDATHSVQLPSGSGSHSTGRKEFVSPLARAACAAGCDGFFFEAHPTPQKAYSDAANSLSLKELKSLVKDLMTIKRTLNKIE